MRRRLTSANLTIPLVFAAAVLCMTSPAMAQTSEPSAVQDKSTEPPLAPRPLNRGREPLRYPVKAERANQNGMARIVLTISPDGSVADAAIAHEDPPDFGFGDAALAHVSHWLFPAGKGGRYTVVVRFRLAGNEDVSFNVPELLAAPEPEDRQPAPVYPREALAEGLEGKAELAIRLGYDGRVSHMAVIEKWTTDRSFGEAAATAVRQWRFPDEAAKKSFKIRIDFTQDALAKGLIARPD